VDLRERSGQLTLEQLLAPSPAVVPRPAPFSSVCFDELMGTERKLGVQLDWRPAKCPRPIELRGLHVVIRPLVANDDAKQLYAASHPPVGDPALWTYLPDGPYRDPGDLRDALVLAENSEDPLFFTLARLPEEGPAGIASYLRITPEHGVIEIGHIWFGASLRRTTAASEAIYLLASHAFDELGYRRLEWKCDALNEASRHAAERFGFRFEGVFRNHMVVKGRNRDTAWYAITDGEWPAIGAAFGTWLAPENRDGTERQRRRLGELIADARR
jgi:RimJ/RimL family protein N-acetyltransferase